MSFILNLLSCLLFYVQFFFYIFSRALIRCVSSECMIFLCAHCACVYGIIKSVIIGCGRDMRTSYSYGWCLLDEPFCLSCILDWFFFCVSVSFFPLGKSLNFRKEAFFSNLCNFLFDLRTNVYFLRLFSEFINLELFSGITSYSMALFKADASTSVAF